MKKDKTYKNDLKEVGKVLHINFAVITPILLGFYLGRFLDKKLMSNGIATIFLTILGAFSGFLYLIKILKKNS